MTVMLLRRKQKSDDKQVDYILGESFESGELGQAIMNRLLKAAGYQVVQI